MIRIFTDFQAIDFDGSLFILRIDNKDLDAQAQAFGLKIGDKVILDAHEDFEVVGTLNYKFVDLLKKEAWVANPDWSTRTDKSVLPTE